MTTSERTMKVRAVLFDYYFTLADPHAPAAQRAAAAVIEGVDYDAVIDAWRQMDLPDMQRALAGEVPPFRTFGERWLEHGSAAFQRVGHELDGERWKQSREAAHANAPLYDDVVPMMRTLRSRGLKIGVLSDADTSWFSDNVKRHQLELDFAVCSEELACYKPHASVFLHACDRLGVDPSDAAYVGDSPHLDVQGALNAGLVAVWLNRYNRDFPPNLSPPDHHITTLAEIPAVLGPAT